jgi:subtilisin family serine protease
MKRCFASIVSALCIFLGDYSKAVVAGKTRKRPLQSHVAEDDATVVTTPTPHHKLRRMAHTVTVPNRYIVVLKDSIRNVSETARSMLSNQTLACGSDSLVHVYQSTLRGFAISGCSKEHVRELLRRNNDDIVQVWEDAMVTADDASSIASTSAATRVQSAENLYWLDRMDQVSLPYDNQYRYNYDGSNVTIYVFDTGIRVSHDEFRNTNRRTVECGFNALENTTEPSCKDNNGHGTFTAALAAGFTYGAAKNASIAAVRVLDRTKSGSVSGILAGLDYVAKIKRDLPTKPMVISMSLYVLVLSAQHVRITPRSHWPFLRFVQ